MNRLRFAAVLLLTSALWAQAPPVKAKPASSGSALVDALKFPPLNPIQTPKVDTYTMPNGLRVYLLEDHELPVVSGTALVRTGNLFDPREKAGLAEVTGAVMRSGGTKDKTGDQIDLELENIAASVEAGIGETSGSVSFNTLKENADKVLAIFRDILTAPEFRQDKLELAKSQLRSAISRRNDDAGSIAQREFTNIVYGRETPYGWTMEYANVDRIMREDLRAFHTRYFFPANVMLAIRGDFDSAAMKSRLEALFGSWTSKQAPVPPFPAVQTKPAPGVYVVNKPDVTQTFISLGHLGGLLKDTDYAALEVTADILGGGFRSRLFQRIRTGLGIAYSVGARWSANYEQPGVFAISTSTKSESTAEAIKAILEEVKRITAENVTDEELKTARQTVLNGLVFAFDTKAKTLGRMLRYEYHGYPKDFIERYQKAVEGLTKADIARVAKQYLRPADLTIVAVGKVDDFAPKLSAAGMDVKTLDIAIPEEKAVVVKPDAGSRAAAIALLRRVQKAVGGIEKLTAIKDLTQSRTLQLEPGEGGMKVEQVNRWLWPQEFRQEAQLPFGKISAYFNGRGGWINSPQRAEPLAGPQLQQMRGELFRLYLCLLRSDQLPDRTLSLAGADTLEITGSDGSAARLTVDPATAMPVRVSYKLVALQGQGATVDEVYGDFREVSGVKFPFKFTLGTQDGHKISEAMVKEYQFNKGLTSDELSRQ